MSSPIDQKLPEIKRFLSERGVKTTGYRKNELKDIAREVIRQKISPKAENDQVKQDLSRRTVNGVTYPHPFLDTIKWSENLSNLPNVESFDVQHYLKHSCLWTNERLKSYKGDNSYRLHSNGHIKDVQVAGLDTNYSYVKCLCIPEERQSADPYQIWLLINLDGSVHSGQCTCVAYVYCRSTL